jgi:hypothetical protein
MIRRRRGVRHAASRPAARRGQRIGMTARRSRRTGWGRGAGRAVGEAMHRRRRTAGVDGDIDRAGAVRGGIGGDAGGVIDVGEGGGAVEEDGGVGGEVAAGDRDARDGVGGAAERGEGGDGGRCDEYADLRTAPLGEPEIAVRPRRDEGRAAARCGDGELLGNWGRVGGDGAGAPRAATSSGRVWRGWIGRSRAPPTMGPLRDVSARTAPGSAHRGRYSQRSASGGGTP